MIYQNQREKVVKSSGNSFIKKILKIINPEFH